MTSKQNDKQHCYSYRTHKYRVLGMENQQLQPGAELVHRGHRQVYTIKKENNMKTDKTRKRLPKM